MPRLRTPKKPTKIIPTNRILSSTLTLCKGQKLEIELRKHIEYINERTNEILVKVERNSSLLKNSTRLENDIKENKDKLITILTKLIKYNSPEKVEQHRGEIIFWEGVLNGLIATYKRGGRIDMAERKI